MVTALDLPTGPAADLTVTIGADTPQGRPGQCVATAKSTGARCDRQAVAGATVCTVHGGRAPQVKRAAARRLAEAEAAKSLADVEVTPIGNPLEALAEVAEEARAWQRHVANQLAELEAMQPDEQTNVVQIAEAAAGRVALYERAMDRCAKFLADWVRLGFDERMVALNERQAALVADVVRRTLDDPELGLDDEHRRRGREVCARHLQAAA